MDMADVFTGGSDDFGFFVQQADQFFGVVW
jgi:hypothetical protein